MDPHEPQIGPQHDRPADAAEVQRVAAVARAAGLRVQLTTSALSIVGPPGAMVDDHGVDITEIRINRTTLDADPVFGGELLLKQLTSALHHAAARRLKVHRAARRQTGTEAQDVGPGARPAPRPWYPYHDLGGRPIWDKAG